MQALRCHLWNFYRSERGSSMAWTAIFLSIVVVPLLALVVDGARILYVQGRLQAAADAAWSGSDRRTFRDEGKTTIVLLKHYFIDGQPYIK